MNKSNCLIYAVRKFLKEGGYLVIRWSLYGWWPHFLHMDSAKKITHFGPTHKHKRKIPPLLFEGVEFEEDKEYESQEKKTKE